MTRKKSINDKGAPAGTLEARLRRLSVEGTLYEPLTGGRVRCFACAHRCRIPDGERGICKVRHNEGGTLYVPAGYVSSIAVDPIEKKPFFHALPGSLALSFGMLGCDYHCSFCQNWITSQALRDEAAGAAVREITSAEIMDLARETGAESVSSTYNEPLITSEWAVEVFARARDAGLHTSFVSNGNASGEVLEYLDPWIDFFKVDLKAFSDETYRGLGGKLEHVLTTIERLVEMDKWVEVVTLVIPGVNDSESELREIASFLYGVSPDIPWHVTAFHPEYRMFEPRPTPVTTLLRGVEIGKETGLRYVYAGNLPGMVGDKEHTWCPGCGELLIERYGFRITTWNIEGGRCPSCGTVIAGRWKKDGGE